MKLIFVYGLAISSLLHGLVFISGMEYVAWKKSHRTFVSEIDLRGSSLLLHPRRPGNRARTGSPPEPWVMAGEKQLAPAPAPKKKPQKIRIPDKDDEAESTDPVSAAPQGLKSELVTEWLPAAAATRIPEWVAGMITEEDYPAEAKAQGRQGKVVASVCIDTAGCVRDIQIIEGRDSDFNQVVLDHLTHSRFRPGLDQNGNPIAVRMSIPVVFELQ